MPIASRGTVADRVGGGIGEKIRRSACRRRRRIMLRRIESPHRGGRSNDLLKYKPFDDAEAIVIGHHPGKGKYVGMVGSLRVRTAAGVEFNVGSGLTDAMRKNPPPLGVTITYQYQGLTKKGKPRFPVFLRGAQRQAGISGQVVRF